MKKLFFPLQNIIFQCKKKLDAHIEDVWTVYKPIKKIIEKFKLW